MEKNIFGNLNDWGPVLEKLEKLSQSRELGNCQDELIRLLRFDQNWRLREAAIESLPFIENPGLNLAREVISLIKRKDLYYDVRILATDGLEKLAAAIVNNRGFDKDILKQFVQEIIKDMNTLLASPEPPKFHDALRNSMNQVKNIEAAI
ncbi:MAG: hypothetical protein KKE44_26035 [Proteobacteria bacterium]|nr:hypothetical protein [Pseudomonadota bacterium]MBU1586192.1 hypothetical protein [Pseudomonadota bacterium]MBU2452056.1 hypothetical protein [Pseudomonadota bacterium]MBU2628958.1 hypothetical protein [Pseudomonadota bacterium]